MNIQNSYFVKKLKDKLNTRRKLNGLELYTNKQVSNMLQTKKIGKYEIVWDRNNNFIKLNLLDPDCIVTVDLGRYNIQSATRGSSISLSSSEYIEFSLQEMREFRLNKLLKYGTN